MKIWSDTTDQIAPTPRFIGRPVLGSVALRSFPKPDGLRNASTGGRNPTEIASRFRRRLAALSVSYHEDPEPAVAPRCGCHIDYCG